MNESRSVSGDVGGESGGLAEAFDELASRLQSGERVGPEEVARLYPRHAEELMRLLPAVRALEELSAPGPPAGAADPGGERLAGHLGDYRIVREVGRGGMGVVYEAEQISLGRRVALKVLPFAATMDARQLQRFHNEARAAASLHHEHIVPVHAVGCERGVHFYAMQFIDGQTLAQVIAGHAAEEPTTPHVPGAAADTRRRAATEAPRDAAYFRRIAGWGVQAAEALEHAHALGVLHRDVKPANLMIDAQGRLWVTDFGLARTAADSGLTMTGDVLGTLRYMSPEQALAKHGLVDHRTDVYSLGVTLYELLTSEPAFGGRDRQEVLRQIAFDEPRPPRRLNRAIPAELETVVLKALEKNPADRYGTAQELADDLRRWLNDEPIRAKRPTLVQRARKLARRHRAVAWTAVVGLLAALVVLAGSVGWVARDRTLRREQAVVEARLARDDVARLRREGKWMAALAVTQRVQALLARSGADPELLAQFTELARDLKMAADLEEIRLSKGMEKDGDIFDFSRTDGEYAAAFHDFGIDVDELEPAEAAGRIGRRTIAQELAAALDDWVIVRVLKDRKGAQRLLAVARLADPNPQRNRLRVGVEGLRRKELEELAAAVEDDLPPPTVILLANHLRALGAAESALTLLRRAQELHPDDLWINGILAYFLSTTKPARLDEALRFWTAALALRPQSPAVHIGLGWCFSELRRWPEAEAEFCRAIQLKKDLPEAHFYLGAALEAKGDLNEAIAAYRQAIQLQKDFPAAHNRLGNALQTQGKLDDAIAAYRQAIQLQKDFPAAHYNLGAALEAKGKSDEAIAAYRKAIQLKEDYFEAHNNLGIALGAKGDLDEAITSFRKSIQLKEDYFEAHNNLGVALQIKGKLDEAIVAYRQAIQFKKECPEAHYRLGYALRDKGKLDEAIAAYREALRLKPDYAEAHCSMGCVLARQGRFAEAQRHLYRGHELGSRNPNWPRPSRLWAQQCRRHLELDGNLPAVLAGKRCPASPLETIEYAQLCQIKRRYADSVRLYAEGFDADRNLGEDPRARHRYDAACAAVLAGCGKGEDAASLDARERARLRRQALAWLQADLTAWRKYLKGDEPKAKPMARQVLQYLLQTTDLTGVRDREALAKLPEAERQDWQKLWADVKDLFTRTAGESPVPRK